uniref:Methyltransferase-like protein 4 n=1 Tax=Ditylenchus dipsaci TaxID=166011 RepID=A0A915DVX6_9BILA
MLQVRSQLLNSGWFEMIKLVTESFVFIDELKFYQALYADDASRFKPKEAKAKSASKSKSKSKKRPAPPKCFLFENSAFVSSVYDQFLKACHDDSRLDQNNKIAAADSDDFYGWSNNLAARSAVKDTCQLDERSIEVVLDEPILYTNSVMKNLMLKNKDSSRKYIIPANSTFLTGDISMIRHFLHREMKYDLIIADPPWLNKSVKRKKSYLCVDTDDVLSSLPIPSMLDKGDLCVFGSPIKHQCTKNRRNLEKLGTCKNSFVALA